ncbi:MAG TPA: glycan-binding surface protein [Bacteroidales bacterium]
MKRYIKFLYSLFVLIGMIGMILSSCKKETSAGTPAISYIRVTDPLKSDSLLNAAYLGNMIAIVGSNLGSVNQIWFNDQQATLNPVYVTDQTILVIVPDSIPKIVTNKMKLVYGSSDTISYDFKAIVPPPVVTSMVCEYVKDGDVATIQGGYFIDDPNIPLQVLFPGNIPATIQSFSKTFLKVIVPSGSTPGPITVKSLYGSTLSKFYFRDNRNIFLDFDNLTAAGGWRSGVVGNSNPDPISGNYVRFSGSMSGGAGATWNEDAFSFDLWPIANGRSQVPLYSGDLSNAAVKFECNVYNAWSASALQIIFTPYATTGTNSYIADSNVPRGLWIPWQSAGTYTTNGWITVTIPLANFIYSYDGTTCKTKLTQDMLYGCTFFIWNGGVAGKDCTPSLAIDNIRIVPTN